MQVAQIERVAQLLDSEPLHLPLLSHAAPGDLLEMRSVLLSSERLGEP